MASPILKPFGRYHLLDLIARGGMAEIYRARAISVDGVDRIVALKQIKDSASSEEKYRTMFHSEMKVAMGLDHPNVVRVFDCGLEGDTPYISMEYVVGKSLRQVMDSFLDAGSQVPIEVAMEVLSQAASGLHYAHEFADLITGQKLGIVHRDISPQNILISRDGQVKVIDFGVAKATTNSEQTQAGMIKGKPSYLSPEQVSGIALDARSDLFALGVVLWEMLTGRRPFTSEQENPYAIMGQIERCDEFIQPPSRFRPAVPRELDEIVLRCIRRDRDQRFSTADELRVSLQRCLSRYFPAFQTKGLPSFMTQRFGGEFESTRDELRTLVERSRSMNTMNSLAGLSSPTGSTPRNPPAPQSSTPGALSGAPAAASSISVAGLSRMPSPPPASPSSKVWLAAIAGGALSAAVVAVLILREPGDTSRMGERTTVEAVPPRSAAPQAPPGTAQPPGDATRFGEPMEARAEVSLQTAAPAQAIFRKRSGETILPPEPGNVVYAVTPFSRLQLPPGDYQVEIIDRERGLEAREKISLRVGEQLRLNPALAGSVLPTGGQKSTPPALSGLSAWYVAENSDLTLKPGSLLVSSWKDRSSLRLVATMEQEPQQPSWSAPLSPMPAVIRFAGTQWLYFRSLENVIRRFASVTVIAVARLSPGAQGPDSQYVFSCQKSDRNSDVLRTGFSKHGGLRARAGQDDLEAQQPTGDGLKIRTTIFDLSRLQFYENGARIGERGHSGIPYRDAGVCTLGQEFDFGKATDHFIGDLAELIVFDHALSRREQALVEGHLAEKYRLPYQLPRE